jgi:hypothetical protein
MDAPKIIELITPNDGPCWVEEGSEAHRDRIAAGFREIAEAEAAEAEGEAEAEADEAEGESHSRRRGRKGGRR